MSSPLASASRGRAAHIRAGVNVEIITILWMLVEASVALGAGLVARSVLLTAFGLDSVIEMISGGALLWRFAVEARGSSLQRVERAENRAAWITGVALALLCVYIVATSVFSLLARAKPEGSHVGMGLAIVALIIMSWLVSRKRRIAAAIDSSALRGDAACSVTCGQMAAALLVGVAFNTLFGLWWADAVAALALLYWVVPEARGAFDAARRGRGGCSCDPPARDM